VAYIVVKKKKLGGLHLHTCERTCQDSSYPTDSKAIGIWAISPSPHYQIQTVKNFLQIKLKVYSSDRKTGQNEHSASGVA